MTTRGKRIALVVGILAALALPKRVRCEWPGATRCDHRDPVLGRTCERTDLEPFGVYLAELGLGRDLPIAYATFDDCP